MNRRDFLKTTLAIGGTSLVATLATGVNPFDFFDDHVKSENVVNQGQILIPNGGSAGGACAVHKPHGLELIQSQAKGVWHHAMPLDNGRALLLSMYGQKGSLLVDGQNTKLVAELPGEFRPRGHGMYEPDNERIFITTENTGGDSFMSVLDMDFNVKDVVALPGRGAHDIIKINGGYAVCNYGYGTPQNQKGKFAYNLVNPEVLVLDERLGVKKRIPLEHHGVAAHIDNLGTNGDKAVVIFLNYEDGDLGHFAARDGVELLPKEKTGQYGYKRPLPIAVIDFNTGLVEYIENPPHLQRRAQSTWHDELTGTAAVAHAASHTVWLYDGKKQKFIHTREYGVFEPRAVTGNGKGIVYAVGAESGILEINLKSGRVKYQNANHGGIPTVHATWIG